MIMNVDIIVVIIIIIILIVIKLIRNLCRFQFSDIANYGFCSRQYRSRRRQPWRFRFTSTDSSDQWNYEPRSRSQAKNRKWIGWKSKNYRRRLGKSYRDGGTTNRPGKGTADPQRNAEEQVESAFVSASMQGGHHWSPSSSSAAVAEPGR